MALPTYTDIPDTDLDVNSPGKEGDVFQALRDNNHAIRRQIFELDFGSFNTTNGSFTIVTNSNFWMRVPNVDAYTGLTRKIITNILGSVSGGATAEVRLVQVTDAVNGSAVSFTDVSPTEKKPEVDVQSGWLDIAKEYRLECRISSGAGTVTITANNRVASEMHY